MTRSNMKKAGFALAVLAALAALVIYTLWRTSPNRLGEEAFEDTGLPERTFTEAKALADAQNKPILLYIAAYWCPTCRALDRKVLSREAIKNKILDNYVFVRIDSEAQGTREIMKQYGVYGFPSLIVTDANGNLIRRLPSTLSAQAFMQEL